MRAVYIIALLVIAAASFFGGYTLGQKDAAESTPEPIATIEASSELAGTATPITFKEEQPSPQASEQNRSDQKTTFEARSQQTFVTFTDTKGRSLEAEVIEAEQTALKIRRKADRVVMMLPVEMLSPQDKAFATYLWEQRLEWEAAQKQKPAESAESDIDKLFEDFFN